MGEDPTVRQLETEVAELLGKEAALLCPSGVFANLCAVLTYRPYHREVILSASSHIMDQENGNIAALAHVLTHPVPEEDGVMPLEVVAQSIRAKRSLHSPATQLLYLECPTFSGKVPSLDYLSQAHKLSKKHNLKLHLDGARLMNAAAHLKVHPRQLTKHCDSIMLCLSKALCAPVGSMIAGSKEFIREARFTRKMMGGGMRQAGVVAGPGLVSIRGMWQRVGEDN
jgi:threonine aldolase